MRIAPATAALLVLALPGCGKRGDPLPPLRRTPAPVGNVHLSQRGDRLEIRYTAPRASVDGVPLRDLAIETWRMEGDGDIEKQGRRTKRPVSAGEDVIDLEPLPAPGTVVRVALRTLSGCDASARTGIASLTVQPPLPVPQALQAGLVPQGVSLTWKGARPQPAATPVPSPSPSPPPGARVAPASPSPAPPTPPLFAGGFWIYRRAASAAYGPPLTPQPLGDNAATDTAATLGARWCYVVRGVAALAPVVESAASEEACLDVKDVFPPAAPRGLSVLGRDDGIELTWSPSPEGDLGGYRVWRATGPGAPERQGDLPPGERQFVDTAAVRKTVYRYTVTAFDQAGNESAPSAPAEGSRP